MSRWMRMTMVVAVALLASLLPPIGAARATDDARASVGQQEEPALATRWRCQRRWKDGPYDLRMRYCVKITDSWRVYLQDGEVLMRNRDYHQTVDIECRIVETHTNEFHASVGFEGGVNLVYASAKVTVSAGISRSVTTTTSMGSTVELPPRTKRRCTRGFQVRRFRGVAKMQQRYGDGPIHNTDPWAFTGSGPTGFVFTIGAIKPL